LSLALAGGRDMEFPILIEPRRSRFFFMALCAFHGLALLGVWTTPWGVIWRLGLSFLIAVGFWAAYRNWRMVPRRLLLQADGRLMVDESGDDRPNRAATLCPGVFALPSLCVFSWQLEVVKGEAFKTSSRRWLAVFGDSIEKESLRRLRVWLRTSGSQTDG